LGKILESKKMADLNTNLNSYKYQYLKNRQGYGDNSEKKNKENSPVEAKPLENVKNHPVTKAVTNNTVVDNYKSTAFGQFLKDDNVQNLLYYPAGFGISWSIDKSVNVLTGGNTPQCSILGRTTHFIDEHSKPLTKFIENTTGSISKRFNNFHKNAVKNESYSNITKALREGSKHKSGMEWGIGMQSLMQDMTGHLSKVAQDSSLSKEQQTKVAKLSEIIGRKLDLKKITPEQAYEKISKVIKRYHLEDDIADNVHAKLLMNKAQLVQNSKSPLSKALSKSTISTGNYIGGSGLWLNAMFLGMSVKEAANAPKGEKVSTFMEDLLGNWIGGVLVMVPIAKVINGLANMRTIGFSKDTMKNLNKMIDIKHMKYTPEAVQALNKARGTHLIYEKSTGFFGGIYNHFFGGRAKFMNTVYKEMGSVIKQGNQEAAKAVAKKPLQKLARWGGQMLSLGMHKAMPKNIAGFVIRGMIISGFLADLLVGKHLRKLSWKLFGKPWHKYKEETEKTDDTKKKQNLNEKFDTKKSMALLQSYKTRHQHQVANTNTDNSTDPKNTPQQRAVSPLVAQHLGTNSQISKSNMKQILANQSLKLSDINPEMNNIPEEPFQKNIIQHNNSTANKTKSVSNEQYMPSNKPKRKQNETQKTNINNQTPDKNLAGQKLNNQKQYGYIPSSERIQTEDIERKEKLKEALAKTDQTIAEVEKTLNSL